MQRGFLSPCNMYHWWEASPLSCFGIQIQIHSVCIPVPWYYLMSFKCRCSQDRIHTCMSNFPATLLCCSLSPFSQPCSLSSTMQSWTKVTVTFHSEKYCKACLIRLVIHICVENITRLHFASFPPTDSCLVNRKMPICSSKPFNHQWKISPLQRILILFHPLLLYKWGKMWRLSFKWHKW